MKLVILDRDGVINHDADERTYVKSADEWIPIPGSLNAVAALNRQGYTVCIASNQSGLARGKFDLNALEAIHGKMRDALKQVGAHVDGIFYCPHAPEADCDCRKPRPGLLRQISRQFGVPLTNVPFIGDSQRDLDAAAAVGARPILVLTGNGTKTKQMDRLPPGTEVYGNLADAVDALVGGR